VLHGQPAFCADRPDSWQRYENAHFIAYSNAADDDVRAVLDALAYIRAAAEQIPAFVIPEGRHKTYVVLPATGEEFARFAAYPSIAGFAQPLDNGAAIVMPASGSGTDAEAIVRHEFAHTLLFNDWFRYPLWFTEGFAELASSIVVDPGRNVYTIGAMPGRYGRRFRPALDWNDIVDERFDAHRLGDDELLQSAYAQHWLLFHYLTMNGQTDYALQIDRYFGMLNTGTGSLAAFARAFGMTPAELWDTRLRDYVGKPPVVTRAFDRAALDLAFDVRPADPARLEPLLRFLTDKAAAGRPGGGAQASLDALPGSWDQLRFPDQCSDPLEFNVVPAEHTIRIEHFYSEDSREPIPALFRYERLDSGDWRLVNVTAGRYPNVIAGADFQLTMRNDDVFCLDEIPVRQVCSTVFQRCGPR